VSFIYVASPYTSDDSRIVEERFEAAEKFVVKALNSGDMVYSPIVHCHAIADKYEMPIDFSFWSNYNKAMLSTASEIWVLQLDGWEDSKGVKAEVEFAIECGIEVRYVET